MSVNTLVWQGLLGLRITKDCRFSRSCFVSREDHSFVELCRNFEESETRRGRRNATKTPLMLPNMYASNTISLLFRRRKMTISESCIVLNMKARLYHILLDFDCSSQVNLCRCKVAIWSRVCTPVYEAPGCGTWGRRSITTKHSYQRPSEPAIPASSKTSLCAFGPASASRCFCCDTKMERIGLIRASQLSKSQESSALRTYAWK